MNVGIFVSFRSYSKFGINTLNAIVINYLICVITGLFFYGTDIYKNIHLLSEPWIIFPICLGFVFVVTFYLIAKTTQKYNVAVATISSKMSMVIPVIFSLYVFNLDIDKFNTINFIGLILAIFSIILCSIRKEEKRINIKSNFLLFIPILVFLATGAIDTSLNYINAFLIDASQKSIIPIFIFASAFIAGALILLSKRERIKIKDLFGGIYLGIPNYFSIYFLLLTLSYFNNNGAVVYPILNVAIIVISSVAAYLLFRERLIRPNLIGMGLAITAIFLISYQDIIAYFS
jgi:drug/metabolite transporter (DMT)-like permease